MTRVRTPQPATAARHRIVYLVLAHRGAGQVTRLVRRLDAPGVRFLVHVDRASDIYEPLTRALAPLDVAFLPRSHSRWGTFALVAAIVSGLRAALRAEMDHVVLLSGQDYPIKRPEVIVRTLAALDGQSLMSYEPFPYSKWTDHAGGFDRIGRHHLFTSTRLACSLPRRRKLPGDCWPYGGPMWWALSRGAVEHVVESADRERALIRFFRTVLAPDEIFFHTLLLNSALAHSVINTELTFADWRDRGERKPAVLRDSDIPLLRSKPHLFARKFDEDRFPGVLDTVERELLGGTARRSGGESRGQLAKS